MPADVRRRAKAINFGIIYGISAFGLANQLGIGREEAGAYIKQYFERFPGIRDYMDTTKRLREHGLCADALRPRCHYPADQTRTTRPSAPSSSAQAINAPIQGSAADIIRRAMIRMEAALDAPSAHARMLLQVHDELVFEVAEDEVERDDAGDHRGDGGGAGAGADAAACRWWWRRRRRGTGRRRIEAGCRAGRAGGLRGARTGAGHPLVSKRSEATPGQRDVGHRGADWLASLHSQ